MYHVGSPSWNEDLETIREAPRDNSSVHCNTHGARCSPLNVAFCCLCCFLPFSRPVGNENAIISCLPCISSLPSPPSTRSTNGYYYTFCTRRCEASQELYDGDGPVPTVPTTGLSPRVSFERSCGVILAASCKYLRSLWARAGGSHVDGGGRSRLLARAGGGRGCSCVVPVAAVSDACALYPWLPCPMSREIGTRASSAQ